MAPISPSSTESDQPSGNSVALDYGREVRVDRRRVLRAAAVGILILLLSAWAIRAVARQIYYLDRDSVQSALLGIPGGRIASLGGFDDGPFWTVAEATVSVDGSPSRMLQFRSPGAGELQSGTRMCVMLAGPYTVYVEVGDKRQLIQHLDFGSASEFRSILPFHPADVRELAARYDEVIRFIESEPSGTYTNPGGNVITYHVRAAK